MECLLRKATVRDKIQLRSEAIWAAKSKAIGTGLPKPVGTHIITLPAMNTEHESLPF
jgi:hypothetical protein